MLFKGWIAVERPEDRAELEQLGVVLGPYNEAEKQFDDCTVDERTLDALNPYWGRFYWYFEKQTGGEKRTSTNKLATRVDRLERAVAVLYEYLNECLEKPDCPEGCMMSCPLKKIRDLVTELRRGRKENE